MTFDLFVDNEKKLTMVHLNEYGEKPSSMVVVADVIKILIISNQC